MLDLYSILVLNLGVRKRKKINDLCVSEENL